jgi:hypothetical protein
MNKSKKERALEAAIELELMNRGSKDVSKEFFAEAQKPVKRSDIYIKTRLRLMLLWGRPKSE